MRTAASELNTLVQRKAHMDIDFTGLVTHVFTNGLKPHAKTLGGFSVFAFGLQSGSDFDSTAIHLALETDNPLTEKERKALLKQNPSAGTTHDAVLRQLQAFVAALEFLTGPNSDPSSFVAELVQHLEQYRHCYDDIANEHGAALFYFALLRHINTCLQTFWTDCARRDRSEVSPLIALAAIAAR